MTLSNGILSHSKYTLLQCENALLSLTLHVCAKMLLHVWSYDFYGTTLSTEQQQLRMINRDYYMQVFYFIPHINPRPGHAFCHSVIFEFAKFHKNNL